MFGRLSRRDFLKGSAALLAALSLSAWFPLARRAAAQSCPATPTYGFTCLPSQLATGQPVTDIATGWDGVQWAVDSLGVPHLYDPIQQTWTPFGTGVDGATLVGDTIYLFRGGEVATYNTSSGQATVQPISALWPGLPPSFTSDLDGVFANGSTINLCRGARFVTADLSATPVVFSAPSAFNASPVWPTDSQWEQGVIGKIGTWVDSILPIALLFPTQTPPDEFLHMYLTPYGAIDVELIGGLSGVIPPTTDQIINTLTAGDFDAHIIQTNVAPFPNTQWLFQGPVVWMQVATAPNSNPTPPIALSSWVPSWFPALKQAPRGRVGSLWSVTTGGAVVYHDGANWNQAPAIPGASALGVDVGEDGVPFAIASDGSSAALYQLDTAAMAWQPPMALGAITPKQVAAGDVNRVYVLGEDGAVNQLVNSVFVPVAALSGVAHVTANHDGTLWHCDGVSANAFRYISEQPYLTSLAIPNVTSIQQVASSAYGNAFLLVQQAGANQLYSYSSPVLFKTSPSFLPISDGPILQNPQVTSGGGRCFVNMGSGIAALDSHTGAQLWLTSAPAGSSFAAMTYDPLLRLLYVTDGNVTLLALDAASGAQIWTFQAGSGPISQPALSGSGLCVVGNVTVYWIDTKAALSAAQSNPPQPVAPVWSTEAVEPPGAYGSFVLIEENIVTVVLMVGNNPIQYTTVSLAAQDGSPTSGLIAVQLAAQVTPVIGRAPWMGNRQTIALINSGFGIWAFPSPVVANTTSNLSQAPTASGGFGRGLALYDGVIYVGGNNGMLYSLAAPDGSAGFQQVLEAAVTDGAFAAGPIAVSDGSGGGAIVFSGQQGNSNSIWIYDLATTDLVQIDTDQLLVTQLTVDENGVLFAAGNPGTTFGQVYAIRIDEVLQQERDFIVDSELMQDFDEPTSGQLTATARYQTHVTVVDALKSPRPFQSIKVWADTALLTLVQIEGQPYYINSTTAASVQTDAAGTLTIVSDATDLSTTPLKLWAGFMNPYERVVVYPDRAFHTRLATTHATPNSGNPDPTQINLSTATTYDVNNLTNPPTLFAANEQPQAGAAATAVQQLTTSVAYQSGVTSATVRRAAAGAASPDSYLAYADGMGAAYGPFNTPANRRVSVLAVDGITGFQFDGSTMTPLSVPDAANAIDALAGDPLAAPGGLFSWLRGLWDKIKSGAAAVVKIVISVGKDLYLGLQYLENGITKVLRQALRDVEDVAIAIGSVFVQLGKDIVKVAEALSLVFQLGHILATTTMLKGYFTTWVANLPQTIGTQAATIQTMLDDLGTSISNGIQSLITYFDSGQLAGASPSASPAIGGLQGVGQTPHTAFTITPQSGGAAQPLAVPAMWGVHKLRGSTAQSSSAGLVGASVPDFVGEFISSFVSNPALQQSLSNARQQFHNSFHPSSAKAFFDEAIGDLLSIIEVIAELAVAGITAGVNTVLSNLSAIASSLTTWSNAQIPVLSTLLDLLGLENVTFLDILLFVAAIPVTLVYRIRYGAYPAAGTGAAAAAPEVLVKVVGIMGGIMNMVNGIFAAIVDADATIGDALSAVESKVKLVLGIGLMLVTSATYIAGDVATPTLWVIFASVISILQALMGLWSPAADSPPSLAMIPSIFGSLMSTPLLLLAYVEQWEATNDTVALSANVVSVLALFVNPLKFGEEVAAVALLADIVSGVASGALMLVDALSAQVPTALPITAEPAPVYSQQIYMPLIKQER